MSVDKTNFGLVLYNQANFYRLEETSSYWSVKGISVFLCFSDHGESFMIGTCLIIFQTCLNMVFECV